MNCKVKEEWQIICTVEDCRNVDWVMEEVKRMLPQNRQVIAEEGTQIYIDLSCFPPLTPKERVVFNRLFESHSFIDIAFLSY
jgi:hypothetical protein